MMKHYISKIINDDETSRLIYEYIYIHVWFMIVEISR